MSVLNETLRTSTISPVKEYNQRLAEMNRERPKMLLSQIKNAAAASRDNKSKTRTGSVKAKNGETTTSTSAPCPCRPSNSNPLANIGPWIKEESPDRQELSKEEDELMQELSDDIKRDEERVREGMGEEEMAEAEKELEEEEEQQGEEDDDSDVPTTTEGVTISPADQQRHLDLVAENLEVGVMFASKPIVQALTNPFVGSMTNRCV